MLKPLLRPERVAELEGISLSEVYARLARGEYVAKKDGRLTLITSESVEARRERLPAATFAPPRENNRWHTFYAKRANKSSSNAEAAVA